MKLIMSLFRIESEKVLRLKEQFYNINAAVTTLLNYAKETNQKNVRICIHPTDEEPYHHMIMYYSKEYKVTMHKHPSNIELLQVIQGSCKYIEYASTTPLDISMEQIIGPGNCICIRQDVWHNLKLWTALVFIEITEGPFIPSATKFL